MPRISTSIDVTNDLNTLMERLDGTKLGTRCPVTLPSGIYFWCNSREEFVNAMRWFDTGKAKPTYQATELEVEEVLEGGLRLSIKCAYRYLGKLGEDNKPLPEPPKFRPRYEIDPQMAELIESKIGASLPTIEELKAPVILK